MVVAVVVGVVIVFLLLRRRASSRRRKVSGNALSDALGLVQPYKGPKWRVGRWL